MSTLLSEEMLRKKLVFVSDQAPGFRRKRSGKGFSYFDSKGLKIQDPETIARIRQLVIPPQWNDVWICAKSNGHIQAIGRDAKGRKQYIYHADFVAFRQNSKFEKLADFARKLPEIRSVTDEHLRRRKWDKEKVLALAVRILDESGIRIGNRSYAKENGSIGLTTLRRKHLLLEDDEMIFSFTGKSGLKHRIRLEDPRLVRLVQKCSELPGYEVFTYLDESGKSCPVDSEDVNEYIRNIAGEEFSSKDFRTWNGTSLTVFHYPNAKKLIEEDPRKKLEKVLVCQVANDLGNTPAVCRNYYIHPKVLKAVVENAIPPFELSEPGGSLEVYEEVTLKILEA